mgnify:CR=1 FL=1
MTDKVLYEKDGRIGRITLNRPDVMNAIDDALPIQLEAAVTEALKAFDPQVIVNTAAYTAVDQAEDDKDAAYI